MMTPTPEYSVEADPRVTAQGGAMWGIWRKQGHSHLEIAVCWHEEDASMLSARRKKEAVLSAWCERQ